ncbi:hypothetical protein K7432_001304 [Basidiobolus ranarum]|uniref:Xylanolytic transcriptional activator regulatory domain-containing protein n=1 Tax=Basidiobolus ranarum TaxID=34480 RepID=A0ABR2X380_9FUNG
MCLCRIAQALGINRVDENYTNEMLSPEQWIDRETKRRIWWMCYVLDRYGASVTRRPLMIDERDCHVLLPAAATAWENGIQTPSYMLPIEEMDEDKMDVSFHPTPPYTNISCSISAVCVELFTIWGKITRYVNRLKVKKWARSNHKPCPQFVALDAELQTWAISLPPQYQYTSPKACNEERYKAYLDVRELNIMYHTCTIILHRINLHNSNTNQVTPAPSFRVLSSLKRCYTAANAISHIIGDVTPIDFGYFNGFLPFCIFTASTVYLSSIISIPWDQVIAETDVALLYWTLQSLSKTMPVSEKYCHILQLLHERPGVTSPSFKVDSVNKMEPALMENTTTCNELFSESQNFAPFGNAFLPSPFSFSTFNPQHVNINYNMGSEIQKTNMVDNSGDLGVTHNTVPQRTLPEGQGAVKWFKLVPKMTFEPHIPHTTDTFRAEQAINTNSNAFGFIQ